MLDNDDHEDEIDDDVSLLVHLHDVDDDEVDDVVHETVFEVIELLEW